ncbi:hypothetical protein B0T26DRAFT_862104 [Lasiosphaeria miniovina]|uniref:Uncharacterized protein n=1 Tax=Lasiosphaeria miniovina TaxID=1954250 RepID=A0AA39ZYT7_9PEZI|nr:uncharacterized protein B0T26DRAFT_862104 [Lasiosphaeria miniovina]KAK0706138.1 hypothetical protein B0T26DRAFT_862104 [Lasiosphaeria miniovina]
MSDTTNNDDFIHVVVTAGGPYLEWDFNTSAMIRDALPAAITRPGAEPIKITKHPDNVQCSYGPCTQLIESVWNHPNNKKVDLAVHIGMNPPFPGFYFETRARRDGFAALGHDGLPFPKELTAPGGQWADLPAELRPGFDMLRVRGEVVARGAQITVSDDAGLYFCEFQLLTSLAAVRDRPERGHAVFLHVPEDKSEKDISLGRDVAVEFITALANDIGH